VLAALVPADTFLLSGIRMSELRTTPLYAKTLSRDLNSTLDDFARNTNFDIRKDVNDILIASTSTGSGKVLLARGNFKIQAPAGFKKSVYKGVAIYSNGEAAYAILDPTTAVVATQPDVRKIIDQKQSGQRGATPLLDRARSLPGSGQIWLVSNGWGTLPGELSRQDGNIANLARFMQSIERATAIADLRSGLVGNITGECRTEQDAKSLGDAARGMIGLGRLNVPENRPELLRFFDGIKVDQKQRTIQINVNISADLIDRMLQMSGAGTKSRKTQSEVIASRPSGRPQKKVRRISTRCRSKSWKRRRLPAYRPSRNMVKKSSQVSLPCHPLRRGSRCLP
jgi:hypothetical protein